jgi:hypothetical protein
MRSISTATTAQKMRDLRAVASQMREILSTK